MSVRRRLAAILSAAAQRLDRPAPVAAPPLASGGDEVYAPPRQRPSTWRAVREGDALTEPGIPLDLSALERVRQII